MAQTGFTPISLFYSNTSGNTPTAGQLVNGELALNAADGKLFYKDNSGVVQFFSKAGVPGGSTTQVQYNNAGAFAGDADFTFNGTTVTMANDASISGLTVGKGGGSQTSNTAFGLSALPVNVSGQSLVAIGKDALLNNTASNNTAVGTSSLASNTSGGQNSSFGTVALNLNTTGSNNSAFGVQALQANTTADNNTAVGFQAGYSNTTGNYNTVLGWQAGYTNSTGTNNTCIGAASGTFVTGSSNTFIGNGAGGLVTSGNQNTILGQFSGNQGGLDIRTASNYIVLSDGAGNPNFYINPTGQAVLNPSGASGAGLNIVTQSSSYTGVVYQSFSATAPSTSWYHFAGYSAPSTTSVLIFGNGNIQNTNNSYGAVSDEKLKENIVDATPKLDDLMKVKVRNYNLKTDPDHKQIGVVAQELETVFPGLVEETADRDVDGNDLGTTTKGVKYSVLVPILIKSVQEQQAIIESLTTRIAALESK